MTVVSKPAAPEKIHIRPTSQRSPLPGQVVLVFQGGGALGAYQAGVYEALHEAGIEPDWIIGTSIATINASLIAGNEVQNRLPRLKEFWAERRRLAPRDRRREGLAKDNLLDGIWSPVAVQAKVHRAPSTLLTTGHVPTERHDGRVVTTAIRNDRRMAS